MKLTNKYLILSAVRSAEMEAKAFILKENFNLLYNSITGTYKLYSPKLYEKEGELKVNMKEYELIFEGYIYECKIFVESYLKYKKIDIKNIL